MTRRAYIGFCILVAIMLLAAWLSQPASEPRRLVPTPAPAPTVTVGEPV